MHMPFCTVEQRCLRCDNVRAEREIRRLREVLRVTLDELLDAREEIKDLNSKIARIEKLLYELRNAISLAKRGKISVTQLLSQPAAGEPNSVMQGVFC